MAAEAAASSSASSASENDNNNLLNSKYLGIYAFIGAVFIAGPLLPTSKGGGVFAAIVSRAYNRFGAAGLLGIPFGSLMLEKSLYDTYCAYHGESIYDESPDEFTGTGKHGGFPSGGASLPSFSLLKTRAPTERAAFRSELLDRCWASLAGPGAS